MEVSLRIAAAALLATCALVAMASAPARADDTPAPATAPAEIARAVTPTAERLNGVWEMCREVGAYQTETLILENVRDSTSSDVVVAGDTAPKAGRGTYRIDGTRVIFEGGAMPDFMRVRTFVEIHGHPCLLREDESVETINRGRTLNEYATLLFVGPYDPAKPIPPPLSIRDLAVPSSR